MTRRRKRKEHKAPQGETPPRMHEPVDMIDGIPDVSARRSRWKYVIIAAVFLAWAAFLAYCGFAG